MVYQMCQNTESVASLPHFFLLLILYFLLFISGCPEDATRTGVNSACVSSRGVLAWSSCLSVLNNQENKEIINHLCLNLKPHTDRRTSRSRFASSMREVLLAGELTKQHDREQAQHPGGHQQTPLNGDFNSKRGKKGKKGETDKGSGAIKCTRRCCRPIQDSNQILCTSLSPAESGEANFSF